MTSNTKLDDLTIYEFSAFEDGNRQQYVLLDDVRSLPAQASEPVSREAALLALLQQVKDADIAGWLKGGFALPTELRAAIQAELHAPAVSVPAQGEIAKDAARLDWLDEVNRKANERNRTVYGWKFDINHNRAALTDHNWPALTVREAIDAAMSSQPGKGEA